MSAQYGFSVGRSFFHIVLRRAALLLLCIMAMAGGSSVLAFDMPKNLKQGLKADIQLGALATFGPTDSSAVSARTIVSFRSNLWEHELDAKLYRSTSEALVARRDEEGQVMRDTGDNEIKDIISSTTNNRRFLSAQSRWFFTIRHYLFGIIDLDTNEPANLDISSRQIGGVGYKLYKTKNDLVSAGVGIGRKKREEVSGDTQEGAIAYLGFSLKRKVTDNLTLSFDLDSDFGSENRYSEAEVSLNVKLRDPVSMKLKYEARFNSSVADPLNTFDDGLESALSINLALEVF